jgi:IclR family acetate operon transcriptional repressor
MDDPGNSDRMQVRSVQRAFDLLVCFNPQRPTISLTEFSRETGLPISTVQRLLATLEATLFIRRLNDGRYCPGSRLLQIGISALQGLNVYDLSEPHLKTLAAKTGETANLAILVEQHQVLYLRQELSRHSIRHSAWLGRIIPAKGTAIGLALLGRVGPKGVVASRKTIEPDVTAIAAPVYGEGGEIVCGFSVTGPSYRISDKEVERYCILVKKEAEQASRYFGNPETQHHRKGK